MTEKNHKNNFCPKLWPGQIFLKTLNEIVCIKKKKKKSELKPPSMMQFLIAQFFNFLFVNQPNYNLIKIYVRE